MKSITINLESDKDAELLMGIIQSTKFEKGIETFEDQDEFTDEDIAEWDRRMAEYEKHPSKGKTIEQMKEILKHKYGV